jgi:hypothetical protein
MSRAKNPDLEQASAPSDSSLDPLDHPALYLNRELSWLAFNQRVLDQARDARWPLLDLELKKFILDHADCSRVPGFDMAA